MHAKKCLTADSDDDCEPYDDSDYTPGVDDELGIGEFAPGAGLRGMSGLGTATVSSSQCESGDQTERQNGMKLLNERIHIAVKNHRDRRGRWTTAISQ